MAEQKEINYVASKTAAQFHMSDALFRAILGPIGSGKSVACVMELVIRAYTMPPCPDGVRRSRFAVARQSYPQLKTTTIKTFQEWVPHTVAPIKWDTPIVANLHTSLPDGTTVEAEILFMALDKPADVEKLKSLELTGAYINELSGIDKSHLDMLTGRIGRYPSGRHEVPYRKFIIADSNMVEDDHWIYRLYENRFEEPSYAFFIQPPALLEKDGKYVPNPEAENIHNHTGGYDYYLTQVPNKSKDWINCFILGNWASARSGKPVWPEFTEDLHVSPKVIEPLQGVDITVGMDFGLTPSAVFFQLQGPRLCVIDELIAENMGARQFISDALKPTLLTKYRNNSYTVMGDPAGLQRAQSNETTCFDELREAGIYAVPAPTNVFGARRDAVASFLTQLVDGRGKLQVSPHCKHVRRALNGGYHFKRVQVSGEERYRNVPEKNEHSHVGDAVMYGCLNYDKLNMKKHSRPQVIRRPYTPISSIAGY